MKQLEYGQSTGFAKCGRNFLMHKTDEEALSSYIKWMADRHCPVSYEVVQMLATDILCKRGKLNKTKVSISWCRRFLNRHHLSARKARQTDRARLENAENFEQFQKYFELLTSEIEKLGLGDKPEMCTTWTRPGGPRNKLCNEGLYVRRASNRLWRQKFLVMFT